MTPLLGRFIDLRLLTREDAACTFRWRASHRAQFLNRGAQSVEQQAQWIAARPDTELNFLIQRKDGIAVGMLSLTAIDQVNSRAEPGRFLIGEPDLVRGIPAAPEAMLLLYELAFDRLRLQRVYGVVAAPNVLMIKWQKYVGMKEEGRLRRHYCIDGMFHDAVCFGLLVEEYRAAVEPRLRCLVEIASAR